MHKHTHACTRTHTHTAFDRVLREVGSVTGATGDGQPGWEQAVMDAAVATADAEAQGATAFGVS
eukprot:1153419-Pelagomonas_calceolata.AAC.10